MMHATGEAATCRRYFRLGALFFLGYVVLISYNAAWLNPMPGKPPVAAPSHRIPFGWEFDADSGLELYSAIDFPEGLIRERNRIARPLKNAVISACIDGVECIRPLSRAQKLAWSYVFHHIMVLLVPLAGYLLALRLAIRHQVPLPGILICWIWLICEKPLFWCTSHTYTFQFFTAIAVVATLQRCADLHGSVGRVQYGLLLALYWCLAGCLTLVKQDLAPFLAVLSYALYRRWFWQAGVGLCAAVAPFLAYRAILHLAGIEWYNHENQAYGQGTWFLSLWRESGMWVTLSELTRALQAGLSSVLQFYGFLIPLAAAGAMLMVRTRTEPPESAVRVATPHWPSLAVCLLVWNVIQVTGANKASGYMFLDSFLPVAFWVSVAYAFLARHWSFRVPLWLVAAAGLFAHACIRLNFILQLPWQHPLAVFD